MEKKRQEPGQEPGKMRSTQGGAMQDEFMGETGEQAAKRLRALSEELPGMEPMLSDPGEPHKGIKQHSSLPVQKTGSGSKQKPEGFRSKQEPGEPEPGWQEHPILGREAVSMQNELEERKRRKMEEESSGKKGKPAA